MGLLGKIFGSDKVISSGIDMLDNAFYTDQERVQNHKELLKLYEPFKLAQRLIALSFTIPFVLLGTYGILFDPIIVDAAVKLFGTPVAIIVGFYFAGGVLSGAKSN